MSKIKTSEEVLILLDKIKEQKEQHFPYKFCSDLFYQSLPTKFKKDLNITNTILSLGPIEYSSLDQAVAYNCDLVIKVLEKTPKCAKDVPKELFANANFALKLTKLMDKKVINLNLVPGFVSKFFENQDVTSGFEETLKEYLFYSNLQASLDKPINPSISTKKLKI